MPMVRVSNGGTADPTVVLYATIYRSSKSITLDLSKQYLVFGCLQYMGETNRSGVSLIENGTVVILVGNPYAEISVSGTTLTITNSRSDNAYTAVIVVEL